ncbi:MAG: tetratricopeptide repeat protein [Thermodesulfobacteriota bacterium]
MKNVHNPALLESRKAPLIILALLTGAAAFLVYIGAFNNGFVTWDDIAYVVKNEHIRSLDWDFLKWAFTGTIQSNYHPLTMISLAIEYAAFGLNPKGYHIGSAVWHSIDTILVFLLALRLHGPLRETLARKKALTTALITALLFGLHPMHVESVAWISERKDVLSAFFFLLAILTYLGYAESPRKGLYYCLTLFFFILALLSKPMAVTLPLVLLLLDYYPLKRDDMGRRWAKIIIEKIPFFVLSMVSAIVTLWAQNKGGAIQGLEDYSNMERLVIPIRAYAFYLYKLILPTGLSPIYPMPLDSGFFTATTLISLLTLLIITAISLQAARKGKPIYLVAWLYYIITLLPVIGIIKVGGQAVADRYTYLPTLSIFILAGSFCASLWDREKKPGLRILVFCIAGLLLLAFTFKTTRQIKVWKDSLTFWSHIIKAFPERVPIAYHKRGTAYAKAGAFGLAEEDFTLAIKLQTGKDFPYFSRALARSAQGNLTGAIADFSSLLEIDRGYTRVYFERGLLYERRGQYRLAVKDMEKALELQPDLTQAYVILARLYGRLGEKDLEKKNRDLADRFFR